MYKVNIVVPSITTDSHLVRSLKVNGFAHDIELVFYLKKKTLK